MKQQTGSLFINVHDFIVADNELLHVLGKELALFTLSYYYISFTYSGAFCHLFHIGLKFTPVALDIIDSISLYLNAL